MGRRTCIAYVAPYGGEWLRTRDIAKAHDRVLRLIRHLTTGTGWQEATVSRRIRPTPPKLIFVEAECRERQRQPIDPNCTADVLGAAGIDDPPTFALMDRFGPALLTSGVLQWMRIDARDPAVVADMLALAEEHGEKRDGEELLSVHLSAGYGQDLRWTVPGSEELLPFSDPECYPDGQPTGLDLSYFAPSNRIILSASFPFERPEGDFERYFAAVCEALGYALPGKRLRLAVPNQRGDGTVLRKLAWPPPGRGEQPSDPIEALLDRIEGVGSSKPDKKARRQIWAELEEKDVWVVARSCVRRYARASGSVCGQLADFVRYAQEDRPGDPDALRDGLVAAWLTKRKKAPRSYSLHLYLMSERYVELPWLVEVLAMVVADPELPAERRSRARDLLKQSSLPAATQALGGAV